MFEGIKATCKRCGRQDDSNTFILDPVYKQMVCRDCFKERQERENMDKVKEDKLEIQEQKPAGWDSEDEYIGNIYKKKKQVNVEVQRIDNTKLKYTCPICKYRFVYDEEKETPSLCPYCGKKVAQFGLY